MTKDNEDALRCAEAIDSTHWPEREVAAHLRRLVAENEAQASLLRQAVEALTAATGYDDAHFDTIAAIRQHLEGRA